MALETTIERLDDPAGVTVIALDGELDASNFESLIETVRAERAAGAERLILDLAAMRFMASSGLVALHSIVRIMRGEAPLDTESGWASLHATAPPDGDERQASVLLCGAQPGVERVLGRTGLDRMFHVHPDRATAIAAL